MTATESTPWGTTGRVPDKDDVFARRESNVRLYCRTFPTVFASAKGAELFAENGDRYIDFFCGAGALNYGHNNTAMKDALIRYLVADGPVHALDMHTSAKRTFLRDFERIILAPRGLDYRVQFCGPTGANAVEAALKLARRATGRSGIVAFAGAFHGMSQGALSVTGSRETRALGLPAPSAATTFVPYEVGPGGDFDSVAYLERAFNDTSSGVELPAAVIVEPMQLEGGVYMASPEWMKRLRALTAQYGVLLICDEIQSGCGRTGPFFCFESAAVTPDIVLLSKSISGYGLPMSLLLVKSEYDVWKPGEHTGTFRGFQPAFVTASVALNMWTEQTFLAGVVNLSDTLELWGQELTSGRPDIAARGAGAVLGLDMRGGAGSSRAKFLQTWCFDRGLVVELCGRDDEVVKVMPSLTIEPELLVEGLDIIKEGVAQMRRAAGEPHRQVHDARSEGSVS